MEKRCRRFASHKAAARYVARGNTAAAVLGLPQLFLRAGEVSVIQRRDFFSEYHPAVSFVFFALVLLFAMCWLHPAYLLIALVASTAYHIRLQGTAAVKRSMVYLLPLGALTALINALFSHTGDTVLLTLPNGKHLTLEALLFGAAMAVMLMAVLQWFACYSRVMTSDRFLCLFGRAAPSVSLLLSMTLGLVPRLHSRLHAIEEAQRGLGRDVRKGSVFSRLRTAVTLLSVLITWALDSGIETADSMKGRGYGLPERTAFSVYRFTARDRTMLLWLIFCGAALCAGWLAGGMAWQYYPRMAGAPCTPLTVLFTLMYLTLCLTPVAVNLVNDRQWTPKRGGIRRI